MSDQKDQTPYYHGGHSGGEHEEGCQPPTPPPPPPPCPDPCDQDPRYGPPCIRPECCPDDRQCCPEDDRSSCTWYEVDDPCVRASSCVSDWTKVDCKCSSSNENCDCEEWDCSCYPKGGCVPCKPCEGLLPEGDPDGGCEEPPRDDCTTSDLRAQLEALQHCISSQESERKKIDADIDARNARKDDLAKLIDGFDKIAHDYKEKRQDLICTEDCLKGFYRDMTRIFQDKYRFPDGCLEKLQHAVNWELCKIEKEKCCYNNLVGKLQKVTKLIWERDEAKKRWEKADAAFKNIQTFDVWVETQFAELEVWKKEINTALNKNDPNEDKWAFYLFYWKFAPNFCKRFPVAFCCEKKKSEEAYRSEQHHHGEHSSCHIGCKPGDWHPSVITVAKLTKLICCAWDYVHELKKEYQDANDAVVKTEHDRDYIKARADADAAALEENIKNHLNKVECKSAPSGY